MFMMIENAGVAPVQSFTMMGLSTARGNSEKIGQFGSGSKHGILTCLRQGINPQIYLGDDLLTFSTIDDKMGEKEYKQLTYNFKGQTKELSIALECGALDWNSLDMGLREFISNAIDAGGHRVEIMPNVETSSDKTRIFLPMSPDVMKFYSTLREKFLHFSPEFKAEQTVIIKQKIDTAMFYRKGVYVQESKKLSIFNYNFGDNVKINESRTMDDWDVRYHAGKLLTNSSVEILEQFFRMLNKIDDKIFENELNFDCYSLKYTSETYKNWRKAWKNVYGDAVAGNLQSQAQLIMRARANGVKVICVPAFIFTSLMDAGIDIVHKSVDNIDDCGREVLPASQETIEKVRKIWDKLSQLEMINRKPFPKVNEFISLCDGGGQLHGFWNPNNDSVNYERTEGLNTSTILHELGHYITGAGDDTPAFTDFFCKVASLLLDKS